MKKKNLVSFILGGGTPEDLRNVLKIKLWNPVQFAEWCNDEADSLEACESNATSHVILMEAAETFLTYPH